MVTLREAIDEMEHWSFVECIKGIKDGQLVDLKLSVEQEEKLHLAVVQEAKQPQVCVNRKGEMFFNEAARKYTIESETRDAIELLIGVGIITPPLIITLTRSLKELAEMAPDTQVMHLSGDVYSFELR